MMLSIVMMITQIITDTTIIVTNIPVTNNNFLYHIGYGAVAQVSSMNELKLRLCKPNTYKSQTEVKMSDHKRGLQNDGHNYAERHYIFYHTTRFVFLSVCVSVCLSSGL